MPSQGNPILKFRCPPDLIAEIRTTIARRNQWSKEKPWTLSDFLWIAAREKIKKMARSRNGDDPLADDEERGQSGDTLRSDDSDRNSLGEPHDVPGGAVPDPEQPDV